VSTHLDKFLFAGHNKARFFTQRFAKKGMYVVVDFIERDYFTDEKSFMVIIKNEDPRIIYNVKTGMSDIVGDYIHNLNENQNRMFSQGVFVPMLEFTKDLLRGDKEPVAGVVEAVPCEDVPAHQPPTAESTDSTMRLNYEGLAAFKGDKLVGFLDAEGARVYNFLLNKVKAAYLSVEAEGSKITANIDKSKASIKARQAGDNYEFDVNVDLKIIINTIDGVVDILKPENEKLVKEAFESEIKERIEKVLLKIQTELNSDIIGFGAVIHKQYPKEWKNIKDKWGDMFSGCAFKVKINADIKSPGGSKKTIEEEVGK
jgi:spore germination protein KC